VELMSGTIIKHLAIEDMFKRMNASKIVEFIFHALTMTVLFLEIHSHFPPESVIRLEVEQSETPYAYSLIATDSDQDYSLEYVKIYLLDSQAKVKQATFQYHYYNEIDLKENQIEKFKTFLVSRKSLQDQFGEEGFHFAFLSENKHFKFNFLFEEGKPNELQFECQVVAIAETVGQIINIPCKVGEKVPFVYRKIITVLGVEIFVWEFGIAIMVFLWYFGFYFGFLIPLKKTRKKSSTTDKIEEEFKPPRDGEGTY